MVAEVEFEPVVVSVTFETNRTGEFPSREVVFEWGEEIEIEDDWHAWEDEGLDLNESLLLPFYLKECVCDFQLS